MHEPLVTENKRVVCASSFLLVLGLCDRCPPPPHPANPTPARLLARAFTALPDHVAFCWKQDRITDHRANVSRHGWEAMMRGELLDTFLDALRQRSRTEQLKLAGLGDAPN